MLLRVCLLTLIGCQSVLEKLKEWQATIRASQRIGKDPLESFELNFLFTGSPGRLCVQQPSGCQPSGYMQYRTAGRASSQVQWCTGGSRTKTVAIQHDVQACWSCFSRCSWHRWPSRHMTQCATHGMPWFWQLQVTDCAMLQPVARRHWQDHHC